MGMMILAERIVRGTIVGNCSHALIYDGGAKSGSVADMRLVNRKK